MKKIRLDADALEVLSFITDRLPGLRGTVDGAVTGSPCYPHSFYQEYSCTCEEVPPSQDLRCQPETGPIRCAPLQTVDPTCAGQPGC
jgi:hypothetical protein